MPSIEALTTSPALRNMPRAMQTPVGVPVAITSPGSMVPEFHTCVSSSFQIMNIIVNRQSERGMCLSNFLVSRDSHVAHFSIALRSF